MVGLIIASAVAVVVFLIGMLVFFIAGWEDASYYYENKGVGPFAYAYEYGHRYGEYLRSDVVTKKNSSRFKRD